MIVPFKVIKANGHVCHEGTLEENDLKTFLRGCGATKIIYEKDGKVYELINESPRV